MKNCCQAAAALRASRRSGWCSSRLAFGRDFASHHCRHLREEFRVNASLAEEDAGELGARSGSDERFRCFLHPFERAFGLRVAAHRGKAGDFLAGELRRDGLRVFRGHAAVAPEEEADGIEAGEVLRELVGGGEKRVREAVRNGMSDDPRVAGLGAHNQKGLCHFFYSLQKIRRRTFRGRQRRRSSPIR